MIGWQESIIIRTMSRLLIPFIMIYALYVIMHGHSSPGGGFQGGVILGAGFILLSVSFGIEEMKKRFPLKVLVVLSSVGVFIYGGIGFICLLLGKNFLDYGVLPIAMPRSMGMLGIEIGVGITVMSIMVSIYRDLITFK